MTIQTIINLESPESVRLSPDGTVARELTERRGFICPQCNGSGYILEENAVGQLERRQCDCCMGFGTLKVRIVAEWMPDNGIK